MKTNPIISVIMPVYNAQTYLRECIDSVLNQRFSDFEFIIIDDCCTDNTVTIISSYTDARIKIFKNETNLGLTKSLNRAIELAQGKYIARMDADDICLPARFEKQFQLLEANPQIGLCGTWYENFGDRIGTAKYNTTHNEIVFGLLYQSQFCHPTVMLRKEILDKHHLRYDTEFTTAQDYELWSRMAHVCETANVPEILLRYRFHTESVSSKKKEQQLQNRNKIIANQFAKMGVAISNEEIELFTRFCHSKFDFAVEEINRLEIFLVKAIAANNISGFLKKELFADFVEEKWFHVCYNSTTLGTQRYNKYYQSKLVSEKKRGWLIRLKFRLRSLM